MKRTKTDMNNQAILLMPEKHDDEFDMVSSAWQNRGGLVKRLGKFWVKDDTLALNKIAIYGGQAFAFVLAQLYNVQLISPDDSLIARLDRKWVKRDITLKQIGELVENDFPVFVKPVTPKMFLANVFKTLVEFHKVAEGLGDDEEILVSSIVDIQAEARCYVIDGEVKDIALYEGDADIETSKVFLQDFIMANAAYLPHTFVVDIAYDSSVGWFVLEFNACWGAGLNNCNAEKVIDCIIGATVAG